MSTGTNLSTPRRKNRRQRQKNGPGPYRSCEVMVYDEGGMIVDKDLRWGSKYISTNAHPALQTAIRLVMQVRNGNGRGLDIEPTRRGWFLYEEIIQYLRGETETRDVDE